MITRARPKLVLVDFDDTIVDTGPRFQNARRELFRILAGVGFAHDDIRRVHHDEIDPAMREVHGLGPRRMEHSFRATYESLCRSCERTVDETIAEQIMQLGRSVAGTPPTLEGAIAAFERLATTLPTALYTQAGDAEYQLQCIAGCGITAILPHERIVIVARKSTEEFRRVLDEFGIEDASTVWMIGNSMRSDINPALEAGANAILVEAADPWEYDVVDPFSETFERAGSFQQAVALLLSNHE